MPRKRAWQETEPDPSFFETDTLQDNALLQNVRNMWEFASLMQYIHIFGHAVKIDDNLEVEDLERACVQPEHANVLADVGLALLKYVSSHRGLTSDLFDDYTRRQYSAKAPERNPFGEDEEPKKFGDFDIRTKLQVLHQLSIWTLSNADRMRNQMVEKDSEQTIWRIEPFGWDSQDRIYYVLDDNRLYRRTEPLTEEPQPQSKTKAKGKSKSKAKPKPRPAPLRSSKRRKLSDPGSADDSTAHLDIDDTTNEIDAESAEPLGDIFGTWTCVAVTLEQYQNFIESIRKSRDPNEKYLCKTLVENVLPELEKRAESQRQKALKRQREFEAEQRMAFAKRSSRIASKVDKQREAEEAEAVEKKRLDELRMAHREQERQRQMEQARESRILTREQRLKDREVKRILHEEEMAKIEELQRNGLEDVDARRSDRQLQTEMERRQQELDRLREQEEEWIFDCAVCGLYGQNLDDGWDSIECEKCKTWQHSACYNLSAEDAQRDDFKFACTDCKRKAEFESKPRLPPLKLKRPSQSPQITQGGFTGTSIAPSPKAEPTVGTTNSTAIESDVVPESERASQAVAKVDLADGPSLSPKGQSPGPPGYRSNGQHDVGRPQEPWEGESLPPPPRPSIHDREIVAAVGPDTTSMPPPQQLHNIAHHSAVANTDLSPNTAATNGHDVAMTAFPEDAPDRAFSSSPRIRPAETPIVAGTSPVKARPADASQSQDLPRSQSRSAMSLSGSPGPVFSPRNQDYDAQTAGQSPVKQPSSSPQPPPSQHHQPVFSPAASLSVMTPATNARQSAVTPSNSVLRASAHMASSPIPPLGDGQVIPQKQDTPRQLSRDGIGETPVVPPALALSPTAIDGGKGMSVENGLGGLGQGNIPVKKQPIEEARMADVTMH